jgi:hypothetical protein
MVPSRTSREWNDSLRWCNVRLGSPRCATAQRPAVPAYPSYSVPEYARSLVSVLVSYSLGSVRKGCGQRPKDAQRSTPRPFAHQSHIRCSHRLYHSVRTAHSFSLSTKNTTAMQLRLCTALLTHRCPTRTTAPPTLPSSPLAIPDFLLPLQCTPMATTIPQRYAPRSLSRKDRKAQLRAIRRSQRAYKKNNYYQRPKVGTFISKESKWVRRAKKEFGVDAIVPSRVLARATGCTRRAMKKIVDKGEGAYYSAGSRPNQTAASWGRARLASALVGGPAARTDWHILEPGCKRRGKTRRLIRRTKVVTNSKKTEWA